jgi:hypothetical protein
VSDFAQTAAVQAGIVLPRGAWDRGLALLETARARIVLHSSRIRLFLVEFDYSVSAELFPSRNRKYNQQLLRYRRFARAADAIRFAIEELPPELLVGALLEVDGKRYGSGGIHRLYESSDYPLPRRPAVSV